jgi:hypothetical protein
MTASRNRRLPPLYRECLERALRTPLPLRSEQHGNYLDLFVDTGHLQLLRNPDWQVVYGRRGTGKTFLLGVLQEQAARSLAESRILSVFVTAQDCLVSPVGREVPDKIRALGYFQTFIELLTTRVLESVDQLTADASFLDTLIGRRHHLLDRILQPQYDLLEAGQEGAPVLAYSSYERRQSEERTSSRGGTAAAGVEGKLGPNGPSVAAAATFSGARSSAISDQVSTSYEAGAVPRFAVVRGKLIELLQVLRLRHLNILIDEWSTLDPTGSLLIQPLFADYLKRSFAGSSLISVKIATNRYQTRFSNRAGPGKYTGLELGADIFEAVNLDRAVLDWRDLQSFFELLLYKRPLHREPGLAVFETRDSGRPDEQFVLSIFRSQHTFAELVRGSEGIPRNFLILVNDLVRRHAHRVSRQWSTADVQRCIRERSLEGQSDIDYHSEASQLLSQGIRETVLNTGSRFFLVDKAARDTVDPALSELLEKRIIHEYPRLEVPDRVRHTHLAFLVDYGLWLDWKRDTSRLLETPDDPIVFPTNRSALTRHVIHLGGLDRRTATCVHCAAVFPRDARPYAIRGLCPECYRPAREPAPPDDKTATLPPRVGADLDDLRQR